MKHDASLAFENRFGRCHLIWIGEGVDSAHNWRHGRTERAFHEDDVAMTERPDDHFGNFICCGALPAEQGRGQMARLTGPSSGRQ